MPSAKSRTALNAESETGDTISSDWAGDVYASAPNIVDDGAQKTFAVTVTFEDFQPEAGTSKSIAVGTIPVGYIPVNSIAKLGQAFAGGLNISYALQLMDAGFTYYLGGYNDSIPATADYSIDSNFISLSSEVLDFSAGLAIGVKLDVSTSIDTLTAGSVTFYITCALAPTNPTVLFP